MVFVFFPLLLLIFFPCVWSLLIWLRNYLVVFCLGFILFGTLSFLDLGGYFLVHFRKIFNYYLLKYLLMAFLFVFFFWDSCDSNVGVFDIVPEVSEVVLISLNYFFFFPLCFIYFHHSIFHLTYPTSASVILLLVPSRVFLICYCIIHYWLTVFLFLLGPC